MTCKFHNNGAKDEYCCLCNGCNKTTMKTIEQQVDELYGDINRNVVSKFAVEKALQERDRIAKEEGVILGLEQARGAIDELGAGGAIDWITEEIEDLTNNHE